jgi:hypothetical protein
MSLAQGYLRGTVSAVAEPRTYGVDRFGFRLPDVLCHFIKGYRPRDFRINSPPQIACDTPNAEIGHTLALDAFAGTSFF